MKSSDKTILVEFITGMLNFMPGWRIDQLDDSMGVYIKYDAVRKIYFRLSKNMIAVSYAWPNMKSPGYWGIKDEIETFKFSPNRNPVHIATKLKKHVPDYFNTFNKCLDVIAERRKEAENCLNFVNMISNKYDLGEPQQNCSEYRFFTRFGEIKIHRDLEISFSLSYMPTDSIFAVLSALEENKIVLSRKKRK